MATSDPNAFGGDGSKTVSRQPSINDLPTIVAPACTSDGPPAVDSANDEMATTVGSPARLADSTELVRHIDRYVRRSILGNGGFGSVYEAYDQTLHRTVAIKVNRSKCGFELQKYQLFVEEARAVARLDHPNIVKVFDVGMETDGVPYVVFEFINGQSLAERVKTDAKSGEKPQPLGRAEIISMMATVSSAMHVAHKAGLVHRDLKPSNILVDKNGQPHVADFGLAVNEETQREQKGIVAGSWFYMSPEQIRGEVQYLDGRTDIWSLGVILYELLAGRRPFYGRTPAEVQDEILNRDPKPLRQFDESIPIGLEQICFRCLSKRAQDRYSSASDLADALQVCLTPKRHVARNWLIASLVGIMLMFAVGAIWRFNPNTVEQKAVVPSVKPIEGPVANVDLPPNIPVPERGKWFSLLKRPPKFLAWPMDEQNSSWEHRPEKNELRVICDDFALIKLGEIKSGDFEFRLRMHQSPWVGGIGVFFGLQTVELDGVSIQRLQMIRLYPASSQLQKKFAVQRVVMTVDHKFKPKSSQVIAYHEILPIGQRDQGLIIGVENGDLRFAEWGDNQLREFHLPDSQVQAGPKACFGDFGVFVESASVFFRELELFLH